MRQGSAISTRKDASQLAAAAEAARGGSPQRKQRPGSAAAGLLPGMRGGEGGQGMSPARGALRPASATPLRGSSAVLRPGRADLQAEEDGADLQAEEDDVANADPEEAFDVGMRQNAMEFDAADVDRDAKLDFTEFSALVREREAGTHSDDELQARFASIDTNMNNQIDLDEYIRYSLRDALARSSSRVIDLFREWDEDQSGTIELSEFRMAMKACGFDVPKAEIDAVFAQLDKDGSGKLEYKELNKMLRTGAGSTLDPALRPGAMGDISGKSANKHALRRGMSGRKGAVLATSVKLAPVEEGGSVVDQLRGILNQNAVRIIDLFRDWDEDGNGKIVAKEFRKAIAALGYSAPRADLDALFAQLDKDGSGELEYAELNKALRRNDVSIDPKLQAGAVGPIQAKPKNKAAARPPSAGPKGKSITRQISGSHAPGALPGAAGGEAAAAEAAEGRAAAAEGAAA